MKQGLRRLLCAALAVCLCAGLPLCARAVEARLPGDVDNDGAVNAGDARLALRAAVGLEPLLPGDPGFFSADVTGDGGVTADDARAILRAAVGLEDLADARAVSQYDMLRGGTFFLRGTVYAAGETSPFAMAADAGLTYMETSVSGVSLGLLDEGGRLCLLNPEQKICCRVNELSAAVLNNAGLLNAAELRSAMAGVGFAGLKPLSEADETAVGLIGETYCTVYVFRYVDGAADRVYMKENRLLAFERDNAGGLAELVLYVDALTDALPVLPPEDYAQTTLLLFLAAVNRQLA